MTSCFCMERQRRVSFRFGFFLSSLVVFLSSSTASAALISKVVGSAGTRVVTLREVKINLIIDRLMDRAKSIQKIPEPGTEGFDREIARVLLEWVVFLEAETFRDTQVLPAEIQDAEKLVFAGVTKGEIASIWSTLEVSTNELKALTSRKLLAKKFINFKTKSSLLPVTDAEALRYFESNHSKFGDAPFSQFRDNIKTLLSQQQADQRINEWFTILQRKYKIRSLPMFNSGSGPNKESH